MKSIKQAILEYLADGQQKTTYQIAKEVGTSWGGANINLTKMYANKEINMERKTIGYIEKIYWWKK